MYGRFFCVAGRVFATQLLTKRQVSDIWGQEKAPPPFVNLVLDDENKLVATELQPCVRQFRFDENGAIDAIPWSMIVGWINLATDKKSATFLQMMTVCTKKKELCRRHHKKRKLETFAEFTAGKTTLQCTHPKHSTLCSTSRTVLLKNIDADLFEHSREVLCRRCATAMQAWSGDGYLHAKQARALLCHMQKNREPYFPALVQMLLDVFTCKQDELMFYKYHDFRAGCIASAPSFRHGQVDCLFSDVVGQQVLRVGVPKDFGCQTPKELRLVLAAVAAYKLWGKTTVPAGLSSTLTSQLAKLLLPVNILLPLTKFKLAVLSVFDPLQINKVFADSEWAARRFVHVYRSSEAQLCIPGVESVSFEHLDEALQKGPSPTVVAWPAQFFTMAELLKLANLKQRVILAGVPHVIGPHTTYGQGFTSLLEQGHAYTSYVQDLPLALMSVEGSYPVPAPIPVSVFSADRCVKLKCPTFEENDKVYFHRPLLKTLLSKILLSTSLKSLMVVPGPLVDSTDAELVFASALV